MYNDQHPLSKFWEEAAALRAKSKTGGGAGLSEATQTSLDIAKHATPIGSTSTSSTSYAGTAPATPSYPAFVLPEYDESKVSSISRKLSAPAINEARKGLRSALSEYTENPNVSAMNKRYALEGFGAGLSNIISGSEGAARAQYGQEYGYGLQAAMANWQTTMQKMQDDYNKAWQEFLGSKTTTQSTSYTYTPSTTGLLGLS